MQERHWEIITKHLSNEATDEETKFIFQELRDDDKFKKEYDEISVLWNSLTANKRSFDKERILKLIAKKISINKKQKQKRILLASFKYAAIFIGLVVITSFVINDLNSTKIVLNNTNKIQEIKLPDNSILYLNKNAKIEYGNSTIIRFNREINLEGEAFFEIAKSKNNKFIVHTPDFDINVLGTKFNVRTYDKNQSVVLTEGKIRLNNFQNYETDIILRPGEVLRYSKENNGFIYYSVNTKIYTSWLNNKLEFDSFSLNELAELIQLRYNKKLIIQNSEIAEKRISGSAPSDDLNLIIQALETILNTKIIQNENKLIIN